MARCYSCVTAELLQLIESHDLCLHLYADDTHIYDYTVPRLFRSRYRAVSQTVAGWKCSNRQLNIVKTKVFWSTTSRCLHQLPQFGADLVAPTTVIWNIDTIIDADLSMRSHVMKTL